MHALFLSLLITILGNALLADESDSPPTPAAACCPSQSCCPSPSCCPSEGCCPAAGCSRSEGRCEATSTTQSVAAPAPSKESAGEALPHLREAMNHLEAAGEIEMARMVAARMTHVARRATLAKKRAQLVELQQQIRQLEAQLGSQQQQQQVMLKAQLGSQQQQQQVMLDAKVLELKLDGEPLEEADLQALVTRLTGSQDTSEHGSPVQTDHIAVKPGDAGRWIRALATKGRVKVLAEPRLITVSGRPAVIQMGTMKAPIPSTDHPLNTDMQLATGARLEFQPVLLEDGRLQLDIRARVDRPHSTCCPAAERKMASPDDRTQIATCVKMKAGQTLILRGTSHLEAGDAGQVMTVLVVRPQILGGPQTARALQIGLPR